MDLVVDANVIFAALIKKSKSEELLFNEKFHFFTPEYFFIELEKHNKEILRKTKRTEKEFQRLLEVLKKRIVLVPLEELLPYLDKAKKICLDPDDVAYFALALRLNCSIWSNDKELKNQDVIGVYSTKDIDEMVK